MNVSASAAVSAGMISDRAARRSGGVGPGVLRARSCSVCWQSAHSSTWASMSPRVLVADLLAQEATESLRRRAVLHTESPVPARHGRTARPGPTG